MAKALVFVAFCCSLAAQTAAPSVVLRGKCDTGLPGFEDWFRQTRLPNGEPYVAGENRKREVLNNYPKLKLGMSMGEAERSLGKPDFAVGQHIARLANAPEPKDMRCRVETAYIVKKDGENMTDMQDIAVYLFYSQDGKLYWAAPQNLPNLKQLGSLEGKK